MITNKELDKIFDKLTLSQKKTALYMKNNLEQLCFMTAKEIGNKSGVSEATVHRITHALGYSSFSEFKKDLRINYLNDRPLARLSRIDKVNDSSAWLKVHFDQETGIILKTSEMNPPESFDMAASIILSSKHLWVAGGRMGLSVTSTLRFVLNYMLGHCHMVDMEEYPETIAQFSEDDTLIVCAFQRYCSKTLRIVKAAKRKGARVITFTDCSLSPFVKFSDVVFYAATNSLHFLDSYTAVLSVVNALICKISSSYPEIVEKSIRNSEEMYQYFGISYDPKEP